MLGVTFAHMQHPWVFSCGDVTQWWFGWWEHTTCWLPWMGGNPFR